MCSTVMFLGTKPKIIAKKYWFAIILELQGVMLMALFAFLIIRIFRLVFSAETLFFSHNNSARTAFSAKIQQVERGLFSCKLVVASFLV